MHLSEKSLKKMRSSRRRLALLLVLVMCCTLLPAAVFAADIEIPGDVASIPSIPASVEVAGSVTGTNGDAYVVRAAEGSDFTIVGDVNATTGDNRTAIYAEGKSASVAVGGDVNASYTGINASNGAYVEVGGDVESDITGISAENGAYVAVEGSVEAGVTGINAAYNNTYVTVAGDVTLTGSEYESSGTAIYSSYTSDVVVGTAENPSTVSNDENGNAYALVQANEGYADIYGDVENNSEYVENVLSADYYGEIYVTGDVTGEGSIKAENGSIVVVGEDVYHSVLNYSDVDITGGITVDAGWGDFSYLWVTGDVTTGKQSSTDAYSYFDVGSGLDENGKVTGNMTYTGSAAEEDEEEYEEYMPKALYMYDGDEGMYWGPSDDKADAALIIYVNGPTDGSERVVWITGTLKATEKGVAALNISYDDFCEPVLKDYPEAITETLPAIYIYALETADGENLITASYGEGSHDEMLACASLYADVADEAIDAEMIPEEDEGPKSDEEIETEQNQKIVEEIASVINYIIYHEDGLTVDGTTLAWGLDTAREGDVLTVSGKNLKTVTAGEYATVEKQSDGTFLVTVMRGGDVYIRAVVAPARIPTTMGCYRYGHDANNEYLTWNLVDNSNGILTIKSEGTFASEQELKDSFTAEELATLETITLNADGSATIAVKLDMVTVSGGIITAN